MNRLFLIRHSLTEGNERRLYYGRTDLPLTEAGRSLCLRRRDALSLPDGTRFAATGLVRTEETLRLLFGGVPFSVYPDFREMDMGIFEMRSYDMLKDTPEYQRWLSDKDGEYRIPDGESSREFFSRVDRGLSGMIAGPDEAVCLVCHGGVIGRIMNVSFPEHPRTFYDWIPEPCHGYGIRFDSGKAAGWTEL